MTQEVQFEQHQTDVSEGLSDDDFYDAVKSSETNQSMCACSYLIGQLSNR